MCVYVRRVLERDRVVSERMFALRSAEDDLQSLIRARGDMEVSLRLGFTFGDCIRLSLRFFYSWKYIYVLPN